MIETMIPSKLETEADFDCSTASQSSSMASSSSSSSSSCPPNGDISHIRGKELMRRAKKLRSIKLPRSLSLKPLTRQPEVQSQLLSGFFSDTTSSPKSTPTGMAGVSPNYMKTTTCSNAKKEALQKPAKSLTRRCSFKPARSLTRWPSTKFRRPLMRKSCGGTDLKKKLKKSISIKLENRSCIVLSRDAYSLPYYLRAASSSCVKNGHVQASPRNSGCHFSSNVENRKALSNSKPKFASSGNKSMRVVTRTSSLRPVRIPTKVASFKPKRISVEKCPQIPESSVHKATCSSTLKDSTHPDHLDLQTGGSEHEGISALKVCPYSYCSLHGHRHSALPPLKRFVSMRRRLLRTQKSLKLERLSSCRAQRSSNTKRVIQTNQMVSYRGHGVLEAAPDRRAISSTREMAAPKACLKGEGIPGGDGRGTANAVVVSENEGILVEARHSRLCLKSIDELGEFLKAERSIAVACPTLKEKSKECCNPTEEEDKLVSYSTSAEKKEGIVASNTHIEDGKSILSVGKKEASRVVSSASVSAPQVEEASASEENKKLQLLEDPMQDIITAETEHDFPTDVEAPMKKQKHLGLWNLIYRHMVLGTAAGNETQPPSNRAEEEEQEDNAITLLGTEKSASGSDFPGMRVEDHEGSRNIQLYQHDAIKLVREAFDRILSDIPDQSSDDQSINSDTTSDKELGEKNRGEDRELSISTSFDSDGDVILQDPGETRLKADNTNASERERVESKVENKSNQQTPKNWSNLKRVIILKRFVKALEKVRKLNLQKPRHLSLEPEPEAEKIHLRHQTMQQRKHSEEWMLDYALQHVISTLAPAQQRKVALLVQAFETVTPPEIGTSLRSNAAVSACATPVQIPTASSEQDSTGKERETKFGIFLRKTSGLETSFEANQNQPKDFCTAGLGACSAPEKSSSACGCIQTVLSTLPSKTTATESVEEIAAPNLQTLDNYVILQGGQEDSVGCILEKVADPKLFDKPSPKQADGVTTAHKELLMYRNTLKEVPKEGSTSVSEVYGRATAFNSEISEHKNHSNRTSEHLDYSESQPPKIYEESIANINVVSSPSAFELLEESSDIKEKETKHENKFPQGCTQLESETSCSPSGAEEKQKYSRLWYLIYKHMASGSAAILEETEKEEQGDDDEGNHDAGSQKIRLQRMEAIRLVEEAIDEIPLSDTQGESYDDQSVTGNKISGNKHLEKEPGEGRELFISIPNGCTSETFEESNHATVEQTPMLDEKEPRRSPHSISCQEQQKTVLEQRDGSKPTMQKSWSNLKKVILLRRFINALEKVKKFNPQKPRFLPLNPEEEAEKVHLRHHDMEDRKNSDEWMLDYALQQVVTKLTPARKRKVALLVEAFETVAPTIGT